MAASVKMVAMAVPIVFLAATTLTFDLVNRHVPRPYMDEIFHIPQAMRYCRGEFDSYDPKLTTPPGLYLASVGAARLLSWIGHLLSALPSDWKDKPPCGKSHELRAVNVAGILLLPWLLASYRLAGSRAPIATDKLENTKQKFTPVSPMTAVTTARSDPSRAAASARRTVSSRAMLVKHRRRSGPLGGLWDVIGQTLEDGALCVEVHTIALLPPLYFFSFLYYTDVLSTLTVVAMFSAARRDRLCSAALLGGASLIVRQTNVVWLLFALGTTALRRLSTLGLENDPLYVHISLVSALRSTVSSIQKLPLQATAKTLAGVVAPFTPVLGLAAVFVVRNGGIVLGDKEHHVAALHWAQACYLIAFAALFAWPTLLSTYARTSSQAKMVKTVVKDLLSFRAICELAILTIAALAAIKAGTLSHPFLLADNRHYAFYLWRKVINRTSASRYLLSILYALAARIWWICLGRSESLLWMVGFSACAIATVVPSPLIEPRYYIIPFLIARMHIDEGHREISSTSSSSLVDKPEDEAQRPASAPSPALLAEAAWMIAINAATLYLFLEKPFKWPDSAEHQRFMW